MAHNLAHNHIIYHEKVSLEEKKTYICYAVYCKSFELNTLNFLTKVDLIILN